MTNTDKKESWFEETEKEQELGTNFDKLTLSNASSSTTISAEAPAASGVMDQNMKLLQSEEIKTFGELNLKPEILRGVHQKGYNRPSNIQGRALPIILKENVNLIAQSQSGTGKTATFGLGMLNTVREDLNQTQALCICPTYELGMQIYDNIKALAQFTKISVGTALKGDPKTEITDHIIIGTPGTVLRMITQRKINTKFIQMFAVDEADQMLDEGMSALRTDTVKIKNKLPRTTRVLLFSATYKEGEEDKIQASKEQQVLNFAKQVVPEPYKLLLIPKEELTLDNMKQFWVDCVNEQGKLKLLKEIYENLAVGQSIIFVNFIKKSEELSKNLTAAGFKVSLLHGQLEPAMRKDVINQFREGKAKVLISTNVLSRGLDIDTVTHVLNYDLATTKEGTADCATYLHRIGRTARYGRKGIAINFVAGGQDKQIIKSYENYYKRTIKEVKLDEVAEAIK